MQSQAARAESVLYRGHFEPIPPPATGICGESKRPESPLPTPGGHHAYTTWIRPGPGRSAVGIAQTQLPADAPELRLAYFSPERAYAESTAGKSAQAKLASLQAETAKEISARNAKLKP